MEWLVWVILGWIIFRGSPFFWDYDEKRIYDETVKDVKWNKRGQ